MWHGVVPKQKEEAYLRLMRTTAIPDYRSVQGNKLALVLRKREGDATHFITFTLWDSLESIRAFAGADVERAKYYDFDPGFLIELEPTVQHYEAYEN
jgi:heme-degrading monooxygenase HmoA